MKLSFYSPVRFAFFIFVVNLLLFGCSQQNSTTVLSQKVKNVPGISVQLWSVKDAIKNDFSGTLQALAEMGFDGVEFAGDYGPYGLDPRGLREKLHEYGLSVSGAHVGFDALRGENLVKTALFHQKLGTPYLIVPWDERAFGAETVALVATELTEIAEKLKPYGLQVGYHNHAQEMADFEGKTFWQYIADNTPEAVVLQQDVGWTLVAGKDPVFMVESYPGRTLTTHFKAPEYMKNQGTPLIGLDGTDWKSIYKAAINAGGAKWIVLEQEQYPDGLSPMEAVAKSKQGFDQLIN